MESRKIIKFGNSSHVISLPKEWLVNNKLNKGDVVYCEENGNNELVLSFQPIQDDKRKKDITINIDKKPLATIKREIFSAYIYNFTTFNIIGDVNKKRDEIEEVITYLPGLEIIDESPSKIIVKDFLNIKDVSINNIIRRMDITLRNILDELYNNFNKKGIAKKIEGVDKTINKLRYYGYRLINYVIANRRLQTELGVYNYDIINSWLLMYNLECIGDKCKEFSQFIDTISLDNKSKEDIKNIINIVKEKFLDVMNSYYKGDKESALRVFSTKDGYSSFYLNMLKNNKNQNFTILSEKFKEIERHIIDMSKIVVNIEDGKYYES